MTATLIVVYRLSFFGARLCSVLKFFAISVFLFPPMQGLLLRSGQLSNKALIDVLIAAVAICRSVTCHTPDRRLNVSTCRNMFHTI